MIYSYQSSSVMMMFTPSSCFASVFEVYSPRNHLSTRPFFSSSPSAEACQYRVSSRAKSKPCTSSFMERITSRIFCSTAFSNSGFPASGPSGLSPVSRAVSVCTALIQRSRISIRAPPSGRVFVARFRISSR